MQGRRLKDGSEADIGLCLPSLYMEIQRLTSTHCIAQSLSDGPQVPLKVPSGFVREILIRQIPELPNLMTFSFVRCNIERVGRPGDWVGLVAEARNSSELLFP